MTFSHPGGPENPASFVSLRNVGCQAARRGPVVPGLRVPPQPSQGLPWWAVAKTLHSWCWGAGSLLERRPTTLQGAQRQAERGGDTRLERIGVRAAWCLIPGSDTGRASSGWLGCTVISSFRFLGFSALVCQVGEGAAFSTDQGHKMFESWVIQCSPGSVCVGGSSGKECLWHTHTLVHTHTDTHTRMCTHTCMHTYAHTYTSVHAHTRPPRHTCTCTHPHTHTPTHACAHIDTHAHTQRDAHAHTPRHTRTCPHTHAHTHARTHRGTWKRVGFRAKKSVGGNRSAKSDRGCGH